MSEAGCAICRAISTLRSAPTPDLVAELEHCYVVLGDAQFYRGYCLMLAKRHATELHLLPAAGAAGLLRELVAVGQAIADTVQPLKLNYECLGNAEPHVHWHLFPRYQSDPLRGRPVWVRPESQRKVTLEDSERRDLARQIGLRLRQLLAAARLPGA